MLYSPFINELKEKAEFEGPFLVKQLQQQQDKNGKPYLFVVLQDRTGEIEGRLWENVEKTASTIRAQDVVRAAGKVNIFQGRRQLILQAMQKAQAGSYPSDRFQPTTRYEPSVLLHELKELFSSLETAPCRSLALDFLNSADLQPLLIRAPAAKSIHHAYTGGLLEHVLSVCRILDFLCQHYRAYYGPGSLNRDIVLLGGLLHDIGKIYELKFDGATEYSLEGQLLGHLVQGCEMVDHFCAKIPDFPEETKTLIKHQILAHHGKLEYGSPKLPHTVEALLVHYIDDLDSKINHIFGQMEKDDSALRWTPTLKMFERPFLKPLAKPQPQGKSPGIEK